ncbi:hypothetical protein SDC9_150898 [bioreactor metagenome]|uniref:Uncharacterized protein n=1 Tax=bioreactor metagenome TaxID=1076179 RepID=A0A645EQE3_9ZZZZ|nr:hypothetical protein [Christensenella sp.]
MKKTIWLAAVALFGAFLLSACAGSPATSDLVYRGTVTSISDDGSVLVTQVAGHNYGQPSILFHVDKTIGKELGDTLTQDAFVEVHYNGALTRSLPAQGTALSLRVIAPYTEGVVQNGTILSVTPGKDGYSISLLPFGAEQTDDLSNTVTLTVPLITLEGLSGADLVEGLKVSAVTMGIAAMSMPPIMPVVALLPYTE